MLFASLSNLALKTVLIGIWGSPGLLRRMVVLWGVAIVGGLLLLAFWPGEAALLGRTTP
ncbi:MAG TPA: hypothetical protein VMT16_15895 [Thermoanaerobaculia bacterium]|nr:hypothetical protein [Thermoanaerobaculia bacterium]